jgi:hypothetical protein
MFILPAGKLLTHLSHETVFSVPPSSSATRRAIPSDYAACMPGSIGDSSLSISKPSKTARSPLWESRRFLK